MTMLWPVARLELTLLRRGWGLWVSAIVALALGVWTGTMVRERPYTAWNEFVFSGFLLTLLLTLTTGDALRRDRARRVDGVVLSAPVPTAVLALGKYLAALATLLGLLGLSLLAAIVTDRFYALRDFPVALGSSYFPSLGAWPYVLGWGLLFVVPIAFGAALMLACLTLVRGGRTVAAIAVVALWLLPAFSGQWPAALDIVQMGDASRYDPGQDNEALGLVRAGLDSALRDQRTPGRWQSPYELLPAELTARVTALSQEHFLPELRPIFYWNRLLFLGLAVALVGLTILGLGRQRRGMA